MINSEHYTELFIPPDSHEETCPAVDTFSAAYSHGNIPLFDFWHGVSSEDSDGLSLKWL